MESIHDDNYPTKCQYCGLVTGETPHKWATEDVCDACASPMVFWWEQDRAEAIREADIASGLMRG